MEELRPGLWWWTAPHPDWKPKSAGPTGWDRDVSCYAVETQAGIVLIDPLATPPELLQRAAAVALTCEWHARDGRSLGLPVYDADAAAPPAAGVEPKPTGEPGEVAYWVPAHHALVVGDVVSVRNGHPSVNWTWVSEGIDRATVAAGIGALLALPIELVLPGHGEPVAEDAHAALAAALER